MFISFTKRKNGRSRCFNRTQNYHRCVLEIELDGKERDLNQNLCTVNEDFYH